MHELGHTLGLSHGGLDGTNTKPNQLSIMNYLYRWRGGIERLTEGIALDYSRHELQILDESSLSEPAGYYPGGPGPSGVNDYISVWTCPGASTKSVKLEYSVIGLPGSPQDFDCDKIPDGVPIAANLTGFNDQDLTALRSYNEWNALIYDGGGAIGDVSGQASLADIGPPPVEPPNRLGKPWIRAWSRALDPKLRVRAAKRQRMRRRRAGAVKVRCHLGELYRSLPGKLGRQPCRTRAEAKVRVRGGRNFTVASGQIKVRGSRQKTLKLVPQGKKAKRALKAAVRGERRATASVTVTARDKAGHTGTHQKRITLQG